MNLHFLSTVCLRWLETLLEQVWLSAWVTLINGRWGNRRSSGQWPASLQGPNVSLPSSEVKGPPRWPRAQADGPPCSSFLYLCWLTQGLTGHLDHLDATLLAFSIVILQAARKCVPLMLCFPPTSCREEEMVLTGHAHLLGHFSMDNQDFRYICYLLLWPGETMGHLQSVPTALGLK